MGGYHTAPKKTKPIGYGIAVFVILTLLVLLLDSTLETRRRRRVKRTLTEQPAMEEPGV